MRLRGDIIEAYSILAQGLKPRERISVSEWADRHRMLTSEQSSIPGRWRTALHPMLREIMDFWTRGGREHEMVVMKSSQSGLTEAVNNAIGYAMDRNPGPMMVLLPTEQKRDEWKAQKLDPVLRSTPRVADILGKRKSRDAANRKDRVDFPGGFLMLTGGNSPSSYDQVSIRDLVMDDLDRFPEIIGRGHDPVDRGRGRTKAFPHKYKLALISTPTVEGISLIHREWLNSDQRRYHVRCPHCHELQVLRWQHLQYDRHRNQPKSAWYACPECGAVIQEHHKQKMLEGGTWIATNPGSRRRGYHINALYIPAGLGPSWLDLATKWNEIHHDPVSGARRTPEPGQLMAFLNEELGEVWQDRSSSINANELEQRKDDTPAGEIPPGVLALTLGIDTQDNWLDVSLIGWREWQDGRPAWTTLDWLQIHGDTASREPWDQLEAYINREWTNAYGRTLRPRAAAIDNRGHRGEHVKAFIQRPTLQIPVYRVQGSTRIMSEFIASSARDAERTSAGKTLRNAYGIWNIGTESVKDMIYSGLHADKELPPEERRFRFNAGLPTEYFNGLLSEVKNPKTHRYEQRRGAEFKRNEPLDGLVYAIAIGHHRDVMIGCRRARLHRDGGRSVSMTVPDARYWERVRLMLETSPADLAGSGADPKPNAAQPKRRWRH